MLQKSVQVNRKILATPTVQCTVHMQCASSWCNLYNVHTPYSDTLIQYNSVVFVRVIKQITFPESCPESMKQLLKCDVKLKL